MPSRSELLAFAAGIRYALEVVVRKGLDRGEEELRELVEALEYAAYHATLEEILRSTPFERGAEVRVQVKGLPPAAPARKRD